MLKEDKIHQIYQEVREEFSYPPTALVLTKEPGLGGAPFYIINRRVYLDITRIKNIKQCRYLLTHELGHVEYSPITMQNHFQFMEDCIKEHNLSAETSALLLNVSSDVLVDWQAKFKHHCDIKNHTQHVLKSKAFKETLKESKIHQFLTVFYAAISGDSSMFGDFGQDVRERVAKAMRVCRSYDILRNQIATLNRIIVDWFKQIEQDQKKMEEMLKKALQKLVEQINKQTGSSKRPLTRDEFLGEGSEKNELEKMAGKAVSDAAKGIVRAIAKHMGVTLREIDFYRARAKRNIRFALKSKGCLGPSSPAGFVSWTADDKPEQLAVEQGLATSGINIPGITTQKPLMLPGHYVVGDAADISVILVIDTSGSMSQEETVITAFSFIEAARMHNCPAGVVLFTCGPYLSIEANRDYDKTEEKIWAGYQSGGTTIVPALKKAGKMGNNNLILVVSDFEGEGEDRVNAALQELAFDNIVKAIVLFNGVIPTTVSAINVADIEELDSIVINEVDGFAN